MAAIGALGAISGLGGSGALGALGAGGLDGIGGGISSLGGGINSLAGGAAGAFTSGGLAAGPAGFAGAASSPIGVSGVTSSTGVGGTASIGGTPFDPAVDGASRGQSFVDSLSEALGGLNEQLIGADASMADFAAGGSADLHTVMLEMQEASIGLKVGIQVRDRLLEAYSELMRLQV